MHPRLVFGGRPGSVFAGQRRRFIFFSHGESTKQFSAGVRVVEEDGEVMVICHNAKEVAEIRRRSQPAAFKRDLTPDLRVAVQLAPGYDPTEPLDENEWPEDCR